MATPLAVTVFNPPYGIDQTSTRMWLRGKALFSAGSYIAGGLQPTSGWNPLAQSNGENVLIPQYTQPSVWPITNSALTSDVVTITATNTLVAGQYVSFNGLANLPFLNGIAPLIVASRSATQFTVAFTHANVSSAVETGQAVTVIGPDDMVLVSQSGSGYEYRYNKSFATIQIFQVGAATPAGTIVSTSTAPTITTGTNATVTAVIATNGGALTQAAGATGITGVQAPIITSTFTGSAGTAGPLSELPAGALPAGVLADIINWSSTYAKQ